MITGRRKWEGKKYDAGLCMQCGRMPHAPDRALCGTCLDAQNSAQKARYYAKGGKPSLTRKCSACDEIGHNVRSHR